MNDNLEKNVAYTYIVECSDGTLYAGWTNDLAKRMRAHNLGTGAKYTRSRLPVRLVYYEAYQTKQEAMKREYAIKQMRRKDKLNLICSMKHDEKEHCMKIMEQTNCNG
ncbi:MAG: GIY-YIG nuclease family protein [Lachnospiraceae bacterium]